MSKVVALNEAGAQYLEALAMEEQREIAISDATGEWLLALAERDERAAPK